MKHINRVSMGKPCRAAAWQDITCQIIDVIWTIMDAAGGQFPLLNYLRDKCTITPPPA